MINWFNMPDEGLSNGGLFEVKELDVTENGTYETKGEMYNKVTVNVEGGGGSSWQTVFEGSVTTVISVDFALADITDLESLSGDSIKVTFNGTEYILPKVADGYGAMTQDEMPDFSEYPLFIVTLEQPYTIYTETAGTYTLKIEEEQSGGSSDFSTAEVTLINSGSSMGIGLYLCVVDDVNNCAATTARLIDGTSKTFNAILYNGKAYASLYDSTSVDSYDGNIEPAGKNGYVITGNCTITIS